MAKRSMEARLSAAMRVQAVEQVRNRVLANVDAGVPPRAYQADLDSASTRLALLPLGDAASSQRIDATVSQYEDCVTSRNLASAESLWIQAVAEGDASWLMELDRALAGWQSLASLHRGDCPGAIVRARQALSTRALADGGRIAALVALARAHARLRLVALPSWLDAALNAAQATGDPNHLGLVQVGRSELAWLSGDDARAREAAQRGLDLMRGGGSRWLASELGFLAFLAGLRERSPLVPVGPFASYAQARFAEAANAWATLGCPYEQALAYAGSKGDEDMRLAFRILEDLEMGGAAQRIACQMQARGLKRIPRGRRASTRANPSALTMRELEVLVLLNEGLRNEEIAQRLHIARKTVDHHVSSILAKTSTPDRRAAAHWYRTNYAFHKDPHSDAK